MGQANQKTSFEINIARAVLNFDIVASSRTGFRQNPTLYPFYPQACHVQAAKQALEHIGFDLFFRVRFYLNKTRRIRSILALIIYFLQKRKEVID